MYTKKIRSDNGRPMYFRGGRLVAKASIPPHILATLEPKEEQEPAPVTDMADMVGDGVSLQDDSPAMFRPELPPTEPLNPMASPPPDVYELPQDVCIFCGQPSSTSRFLNGQKVALCQDDYQTKTTGETVAAMREFIQTKG